MVVQVLMILLLLVEAVVEQWQLVVMEQALLHLDKVKVEMEVLELVYQMRLEHQENLLEDFIILQVEPVVEHKIVVRQETEQILLAV
tara:strand:- start:161 stop:421 length:261 start_codon:yes stop_codon:yes gene_type:complete